MFIGTEDDFNSEKTANCGQCFRAVRIGDDGWRFQAGSRAVHIRKKDMGIEADCSLEEWRSFWRDYFDMDRNYSEIRSKIPEEDCFMREAAATGAGIRILRQDPWEMLVTFILSQRKSIPAIRRCVETLAGRYGKAFHTRKENLYAFPEADRLACAEINELYACKLGYRAPYVLDAACRVRDGRLNLKELASLDDEALVRHLKEVKGVGDKVADCVALFGYGRAGRAPVDTWILKVIEDEYGGANPFPKYGKNAGIMQQYVFYYMQQQKKKDREDHKC